MSRVGKQIIEVPTGVTVKTVASSLGTIVTVAGSKGGSERFFRPEITISIEANQVTLTPRQPDLDGALWGTYASHVKNMVTGAATGFTKQLILEGIGYKGAVAGQTLTLNVGFSHPVVIVAPAGVKISLEKNVLTVTGSDKELVGQFSASVKAIKPPDPYKEKGIRYLDEKITRKQGKKVVS